LRLCAKQFFLSRGNRLGLIVDVLLAGDGKAGDHFA
jgi:hypothetical protein